MYEADFARTAQRLQATGLPIRPLLIGRNDTAASHRPEIVWITRQGFDDGLADVFFGAALHAPGVRWVQTFNAGLDMSFRKMLAYGVTLSARTIAVGERAGLDTSIFRPILDRGARLSTSNAMAAAIAEYVMAQVLAEWHPIAQQRAAQQAATWRQIPFPELWRSRWLIVGYGNNGREVAARARAFGAHVLGVKRTPDADGIISPRQLHDALPEADIVVLACPLTEQTRDLADARFFARMKPGSLLVNIARGGLIDETALFAALDAEAPRLAILDAFRQEPLPADDPLWRHPRVRMTAHCSWAGNGITARGDDQFIENLKRYHRGEPLINEVGADAV